MDGLQRHSSDNDFKKYVSNYDFLCLTETWLNNERNVEIDNFAHVKIPGKKGKRTRGRLSGGVSFYYKSEYEGYFDILESNNNGMFWIKFKKDCFGFNEDLYLCIIYILPQDSQVLKRNDVDFFDLLENSILKYKNLGNLFIVGDLNARVGNLEFEFEEYLNVITEKKFRSVLTRFRISSHCLEIENGRFYNVEKSRRICNCCNMKVQENEYHFLLVCPIYIDLRRKYFSNYYCNWPNIQKFTSILSSKNASLIKKNLKIFIPCI